MVRGFTNFALAGQEDQNIAGAVRAEPELIDRIGNRVIEVVVARFFIRPIALLDRKHAARHHDDRRWNRQSRHAARLGIATGPQRTGHGGKVVGKALRINRRRGDDHFQVWPARQQLAQIAEQKIDVQTALVGLVNDDGVVSIKQRIGLRLGQQNAVGHELDGRIAAQPVLKTHLVADHIAQRGFQFFGDAFGHTGGGNPARLGVAYQFGALARRVVKLAAPDAQRNFRQLRGLARAGFAADNDDLVRLHGGRNLFATA